MATELDAQLARWTSAELLTPEQADAIREYETREPPARTAGKERRVPLVAEALGYLGGVLATIGAALVIAQYWSDMTPAGRSVIGGGAALGLLGAGALVSEHVDPALRRLRWFLWLASTAAAGLTAGVLADALDTGAENVAVVVSGTVALESALLWRARERPLQQLTFFGGLMAFAISAVARVAPDGAPGLAVWVIGATLIVLGLRHRAPTPLLTLGIGSFGVVVGGLMTLIAWPGIGGLFAVASALALLAVALVPASARHRGQRLVTGIAGGVALLQFAPATLGFFGTDAGIATGSVTATIGATLIAVAARRLVLLPVIAGSAGAVTMIGGAAITGAQAPGFASLFGIVVALGLLAVGARPGQVMMSVFGSLGLLVNIPWAIGWFFPGEARAPLLIMISGALIIAAAVFLTRMGGRFRRELGVRSRPEGSGPDALGEERKPTDLITKEQREGREFVDVS